MSHYQQLRYYDPILDRQAVRISMFNARGDEYWCTIVLAPEGRPRRESREKALDALMAAMEAAAPGEVVVESSR